jgi:histidyl-tRNA synthetase
MKRAIKRVRGVRDQGVSDLAVNNQIGAKALGELKRWGYGEVASPILERKVKKTKNKKKSKEKMAAYSL